MKKDRRQGARAGGSLMAASIIGGVLLGIIAGEASLGFLTGAVLGIAVLGLLWLWDRSR
jgi:hypothetical protein